MALNLQLNALQLPQGTEFPGTVQDLLQLIEEYMEITGGEDFDGVNYGNTEPSADDRDKPWFRTDLSGTPLGWYAWSGSEWEVLPAKAFVGSVADRDAIDDPQEGTMFLVTGTGLQVYNGTTWENSYPSPAVQTSYDRFYFFDSYQQVASTGSATGGWEDISLADLLSTAGLNSAKAVLVAVDCGFSQSAFGSTLEYNVSLRVTQDDTQSTSSNTLLKAIAQASRDDDRVSTQQQSFGFVPLTAAQDVIYYNVQVTNSPPGSFARVYVVGFVY